MTGPPVGRDSTVKFLATADLGHAQTDGSTEIDHEQAKDDLNTTPEGTLQYVSASSSDAPHHGIAMRLQKQQGLQ